MAEKSRSELVVDLVKALVWPVIILFMVFWLGNDFKSVLMDILENRHVKLGSLEIGERVTTLKTNVQKELDDQRELLQKILDDAEQASATREYAEQALSRLQVVEKEVNREVRDIQLAVQSAPSKMQEERSEKNVRQTVRSELEAELQESQGFEYLLKRDAKAALQAFSEAERNWPDYHNVAEIRALLEKNIGQLASPESSSWPEVYHIILEKYSWGMPNEIRNEMREFLSTAKR